MSDYRDTETVVVKRRSSGTTIAIILVVIAVIVGLLFATGFWSADVTKSGALPEVAVKGGSLPSITVAFLIGHARVARQPDELGASMTKR